MIVMLINTYYVCKYTDMKFNIEKWLLRPGAAAAVMGIVVWLMQRYLPLNRVTTIAEVAVGVAVYGAAAVALKVLSVSDIRNLLRRKGKKV